MNPGRRDFLKRLMTGAMTVMLPPSAFAATAGAHAIPDAAVRDYITKMRHFDARHPTDVYLSPHQCRWLKPALGRLSRIQRIVGHGNFHLLSIDDAFRVARAYPQIGRFSREETALLESLFYTDAAVYGFFGDKPMPDITHRIRRKDISKIPGSGNYIYRGAALDTYRVICREIGRDVVLTSGIRSVIKQFHLFLSKTYRSNGNLSLASRSLAPPGYSYHAIGDFDVGQVGLGPYNFTEKFAESDVFHRLQHLGYIRLRYSRDNLLGVRFEPWHIRIAPDGAGDAITS